MSAGELRAEFSRDGSFYYRGHERITADEWHFAMGELAAMQALEREIESRSGPVGGVEPR